MLRDRMVSVLKLAYIGLIFARIFNIMMQD